MTTSEIITLIICGAWMVFWFVIIIRVVGRRAMKTSEIITLIVCGAWMVFWFVIIIKANIEYWRMPREWRRDITHDLYW